MSRDDAKGRLLLCGAAVVLAVCAAYFEAASLQTFTFDDHLAIEGNTDTTVPPGGAEGVVTSWSVWLHDFWGRPLHAAESHRSYRPLTVVSFRVEYVLAGYRHDPALMHRVNVALHALASLLVLLLLDCTLAVHLPQCAGGRGSARSLGALAGALLFAVHAIHTEAVASIVGRSELLCAVFGLSSTLVFCFAEQRSLPLRGAAAAFLLLAAVLCKDSGVVFGGLSCLMVAAAQMKRGGSRWQLLAHTAAAAAPTASLVLCRWWVLGVIDLRTSALLRREENPHLFMSPNWRWAFLWYLQAKNLWLLLWPHPLCAEYSYNCLPSFDERGFADERLLAVAVTTAAAGAFLAALLWKVALAACRIRATKAGDRLLAPSTPLAFLLSAAWIVTPYLPVSHLFVTVGTMLAERCLYVPSIGLSMMVAVATAREAAAAAPDIQRARSKRPARWSARTVAMAATIGALLIAHTALCVWRCRDWASDEALFESAISVCPNSAKHHQQLALLRFNQQRFDEGAHLLQRAMALDAESCEAPYHLARYHLAAPHGVPAHALPLLRSCSRCVQMVSKCIALHDEAVKVLQPQRSPAQALLDRAALFAASPALHASQLRHAGLALGEEGRWCAARRAFEESVSVRVTHGLFGVALPAAAAAGAAQEPKPALDNTLCNTRYWLGHSALRCSTSDAVACNSSALLAVVQETVWVCGLRRARALRPPGAAPSDVAAAVAGWLGDHTGLGHAAAERRDRVQALVAALTSATELLHHALGDGAGIATATPEARRRWWRQPPQKVALLDMAVAAAEVAEVLVRAAKAVAADATLAEAYEGVALAAATDGPRWEGQLHSLADAASAIASGVLRPAASDIATHLTHTEVAEATFMALASQLHRASMLWLAVPDHLMNQEARCERFYFAALAAFYALGAGASAEEKWAPPVALLPPRELIEPGAAGHVQQLQVSLATCARRAFCPATASLCTRLREEALPLMGQ